MQEYSDYETDKVRSNPRKVEKKPKKTERKLNPGITTYHFNVITFYQLHNLAINLPWNHLCLNAILEANNKKELNDIWYALDYQDRRINKLVEENKEYKDKISYLENHLDGEVKDIKKQIKGIKSNLESIVDIVKVWHFHE